MKTRFLFAVALAFAPLAWSADPAPAAQPPPITDEQIVAQFRSDLMAKARRHHGQGTDADGR